MPQRYLNLSGTVQGKLGIQGGRERMCRLRFAPEVSACTHRAWRRHQIRGAAWRLLPLDAGDIPRAMPLLRLPCHERQLPNEAVKEKVRPSY